MRWIARAPGKLFVLGEYAVLDGTPAVVAAVDRFVEVSVETTARAGRVLVVAPQLDARAEFDATDTAPPEGTLRFVMAAYQTAPRRVPSIRKCGVAIETRDHLRADDGTKIGLGGSAAITVATLAALLSASATEVRAVERSELLVLGLDAHALGQGVAGSGADVAASVYGGLIQFRRGTPIPEVEALDVPASFKLLVGWTGSSASTGSQVAKYLAADGELGLARRRFCKATEACVAQFVNGLREAAISSEQLDRNDAALRELEGILGLTLHTPDLDALIEGARRAGAGAKPSGAGGGDCAIAVTGDADVAERVRANWREDRLLPLDLGIAADGVTVRSETTHDSPTAQMR